MEDQRVRFLTLDVLCGPTRRPADIDTSTLVFVYALRHKKVYVPAANEFQRQLIRGRPIFRGGRSQALITEATENGHREATHMSAGRRASGEIARTGTGPRLCAAAMWWTATPTASRRRSSRGIRVPAPRLLGDGRRWPRICPTLDSPEVTEDREPGRLSPWRKVTARAARATREGWHLEGPAARGM